MAGHLRRIADAVLKSQPFQFGFIDDDGARLGQQCPHFRRQIVDDAQRPAPQPHTDNATMSRTAGRLVPVVEFVKIVLHILNFRLVLHTVHPGGGDRVPQLDAGRIADADPDLCRGMIDGPRRDRQRPQQHAELHGDEYGTKGDSQDRRHETIASVPQDFQGIGLAHGKSRLPNHG